MKDTLIKISAVFICFYLLVIGVALLFGLTMMIVAPFNYYTCKKGAEIMEIDYKYNAMAGCFYKENGKYVKVIENTSEGIKVYQPKGNK